MSRRDWLIAAGCACAVGIALAGALGFRAAVARWETADARAAADAAAERARMLIPEDGYTREQAAAVRIGMTADEVTAALDHSYALGVEMFPYGMAAADHFWSVHDLPIRGEGYIQAVFVDKILVGFGCLEPADGRLCRGCLDAMLMGERDWSSGLPCIAGGACSDCGGSEPVPLGATLDALRRG